MKALLFSLLILFGCRESHEDQAAKTDPRLPELREKMALALEIVKATQDEGTGWLMAHDADAMIWNGKLAAANGVKGVDLEAAEDKADGGRFYRCPYDNCRHDDNPDWCDWSRDMANGLFAYAWRHRDLDLLKRHAAYGKAHDWLMGNQFGDGRCVYTPAMIGRLYQTIFALGGPDSPNRIWPDFYASGLKDYQAHLQVMSIWHRGEVEGNPHTADATPAHDPVPDDPEHPAPEGFQLNNISGGMLDRLVEHAVRDPKDPLFQAVLGTYTGDMGPAITACLGEKKTSWYAGEYARSDDGKSAVMAGWVFACDIVLRRFK